MRRRACLAMVVGALAFWFGAAPGHAKTILLTDEETDQMAAIAADAPRLSWAGMESVPGVWNVFNLELYPNRALLIRFPLDKLPKRQRITKAELIVPIDYVYGDARLYVRRLLAEWGPGVCHLYRTTRPKPIEWKVPGAKGSGSDRIAKPQVLKVLTATETTINVTEDVELWYSGAVRNQGWMMTNDDNVGMIRMGSWAFGGRGRWKLRITYEPE